MLFLPQNNHGLLNSIHTQGIRGPNQEKYPQAPPLVDILKIDTGIEDIVGCCIINIEDVSLLGWP